MERATPHETPASEEQDRPASRALTRRPPGRPKGTDYRRADAPLHEQMRQLLQDGVVHCRTAAASRVVGEEGELAYGHGCKDSKIRRLVRRYLY